MTSRFYRFIICKKPLQQPADWTLPSINHQRPRGIDNPAHCCCREDPEEANHRSELDAEDKSALLVS